MFLTGASGVVGSEMRPILVREGFDVSSIDIRAGGDVSFLDVRDGAQVNELVQEAKPDIVIHLAAEIDVDRCEIEPDHAYRTNTLGTWNVALACQRGNIPMAYVSTAGVFDGMKSEPYTEFDSPNPVNVYGRSKLEGEKIVQRLLSKFFIVRAAWMIGGGPTKDTKFVGKIISQLKDGAKQLRAVNDKIGSLTYALDFSECITRLIKTDCYGLYHMANTGTCTRYDVAKEVLEIFGRKDVELYAVSSDAFVLPAPRAKSEMLRNYCLEMRGLNLMRDWREAMKDYLKRKYIDA